MGITCFYSWLKKRYPLISKNFADISRPIINNLYIDFNQLLFVAKDMNKLNFPQKAENADFITNEILRFLDEIVQFVRPTTLLFIAIDGTPPYNKIFNQINGHLNKAIDPKTEHDEKNIDFISGAPFMLQFQSDLQQFIEEKTTKDAAWKNAQVVYSSVNNPGETEHKIFEFIKERSKSNQTEEVHCIYSNDADIIPLIMLTPENNFLLMRKLDKPDFKYWLTESYFELVYVNILREYLISDIENNDESSDIGSNKAQMSKATNLLKLAHPRKRVEKSLKIKLDNIFTDWVFLISLVGNDFFNGFSYFYKKKEFVSEKFQLLMNLYEKHILKQNMSLVNNQNEINYESLFTLLDAFLIQIGEPYQYDTYNDKVSLECEKLLNNLNWLLKYYLEKCPSWSYHYSCDLELRNKMNVSGRYPLSFSDLCIFIQKRVITPKKNVDKYHPPSFEDGSRPLKPFEALVCRYPSWRLLLPQYLKDIVEDYQKKYQDEIAKKHQEELLKLNQEKDQETDTKKKKKKNKGNEQNQVNSSDPYYKLITYEVSQNLVSQAASTFVSTEQERNKSSQDFYIIEEGETRFGNFELITKKRPPQLWIPSLNKITQFFCKGENNLLMPTLHLQTNDLTQIKEELINKVILVDYPFLKPAIVKDVIFENQRDIASVTGIETRTLKSFQELEALMNAKIEREAEEKAKAEAEALEKDKPKKQAKKTPKADNNDKTTEKTKEKTESNDPKEAETEKKDVTNIVKNESNADDKALTPEDEKARKRAEREVFAHAKHEKKMKMKAEKNEKRKAEEEAKKKAEEEAKAREEAEERARFEDNVITIVAYPLVLSSTNHSSVSICSQPEKYPYCLTVPVVPKLSTVFNNLYFKESIVQIDKDVLIPNGNKCLFGIIKKIDKYQRAHVLTYKQKEPDLTEYFNSKIIVNQNGPFSIIQNDDLRRLEYILKPFKSVKGSIKKNDDPLVIDLDSIIWEGKKINREQYVEIGDRAICITHGGPINFGQTGTVVGYNSKLEEVYVLLDRKNIFGCCFYGQLKTKRGIIGKTYDFLIMKRYRVKNSTEEPITENTEIENVEKNQTATEMEVKELKIEEKRIKIKNDDIVKDENKVKDDDDSASEKIKKEDDVENGGKHIVKNSRSKIIRKKNKLMRSRTRRKNYRKKSNKK